MLYSEGQREQSFLIAEKLLLSMMLVHIYCPYLLTRTTCFVIAKGETDECNIGNKYVDCYIGKLFN